MRDTSDTAIEVLNSYDKFIASKSEEDCFYNYTILRGNYEFYSLLNANKNLLLQRSNCGKEDFEDFKRKIKEKFSKFTKFYNNKEEL